MIHREPLVVTGAFRASAWRGEHAPLTVLTTSVATTAAAAIGSLTTSKSVTTWYPTLRKPGFTPPRAAFPIAWTALYADTAVTTAAAYDRLRSDGRDAEARALAGALGVNLTLNAGWSVVFFGAHRLGPAALLAAALTASSADLTRRTSSASTPAGVALAPYPLWCAFATALSTQIWRLNR